MLPYSGITHLMCLRCDTRYGCGRVCVCVCVLPRHLSCALHGDCVSFTQHGDTAVYWAARQGHLEVIRYLVGEGVSLNTQNKVNATNTVNLSMGTTNLCVCVRGCMHVCMQP